MRDLRDLRNALAAEAERVRSEGVIRLGASLEPRLRGLRAAPSSPQRLVDDAVGGLPAMVFFFDFHTAIASTEALRLAGITGARVVR